MRNICKFVPLNNYSETIQIINFVHETKEIKILEPKISSVYRINYVNSGSAVIQCGAQRRIVYKNDIFFIIPSVPYLIEGDEDFTYSYISFFGTRASFLLDKLKIDYKNFAFTGVEVYSSIWQKLLNISDSIGDLAYEGVVLYTFACIGDTVLAENSNDKTLQADKFMLIKKYIDDNFSDSNLTLNLISKKFAYNKKYLSTSFKKNFKVGITEYVNTLRINHACVLMEQNYTSVSDIAYLCGFSDPFYFSKLFKANMKVSPKEFIKSINSNKKSP